MPDFTFLQMRNLSSVFVNVRDGSCRHKCLRYANTVMWLDHSDLHPLQCHDAN